MHLHTYIHTPKVVIVITTARVRPMFSTHEALALIAGNTKKMNNASVKRKEDEKESPRDQAHTPALGPTTSMF